MLKKSSSKVSKATPAKKVKMPPMSAFDVKLKDSMGKAIKGVKVKTKWTRAQIEDAIQNLNVARQMVSMLGAKLADIPLEKQSWTERQYASPKKQVGAYKTLAQLSNNLREAMEEMEW